MHFVKLFSINGIDTKQVACIELQGVPNAATEGAVGVLGMDMTSPTHDIYKCVAKNGSVYTWELLSSGSGGNADVSALTRRVSTLESQVSQLSYVPQKVSNLESQVSRLSQEISEDIGDISAALDELHTYAQSYGGEEE